MRAMQKLLALYGHVDFGVSLSVLSAQKLWLNTRQRGEREDKFIMMGMRGSNWVGFVMLAIFIIAAEPIWLFLGFDTEFDTTKILWAIPVAAYVIVAVVLLIRGGPDRDLS